MEDCLDVSLSYPIYRPCLIARVDNNAMNLPIKLLSKNRNRQRRIFGLWCWWKVTDQNYTRMKGIKMEALKEPIRVYNVDGTPNKQGSIRYYVDLKIKVHGQTQKERLLVTGLGKHRIILGLPWLRETNPIIDWRKGTLEWREQEK